MRLRTIGIMLLILFWSSCGYGITSPTIQLSADEHDFGEIRVGDIVHTAVNVTNSGDTPLTIIKLKSSCGCTTPKISTEKVPSKGSAELRISFDSTGLSAGKKTQTVYVHSDDPAQPVIKVRIFANVIHELALNPSSLIMRIPRSRKQLSFPVKFKNNSASSVALKILKVMGAVERAALGPEKVVGEPGSTTAFHVDLDLVKKENKGLYRGQILLETSHPQESKIVLRCFIKAD